MTNGIGATDLTRDHVPYRTDPILLVLGLGPWPLYSVCRVSHRVVPRLPCNFDQIILKLFHWYFDTRFKSLESFPTTSQVPTVVVLGYGGSRTPNPPIIILCSRLLVYPSQRVLQETGKCLPTTVERWWIVSSFGLLIYGWEGDFRCHVPSVITVVTCE